MRAYCAPFLEAVQRTRRTAFVLKNKPHECWRWEEAHTRAIKRLPGIDNMISLTELVNKLPPSASPEAFGHQSWTLDVPPPFPAATARDAMYHQWPTSRRLLQNIDALRHRRDCHGRCTGVYTPSYWNKNRERGSRPTFHGMDDPSIGENQNTLDKLVDKAARELGMTYNTVPAGCHWDWKHYNVNGKDTVAIAGWWLPGLVWSAIGGLRRGADGPPAPRQRARSGALDP